MMSKYFYENPTSLNIISPKILIKMTIHQSHYAICTQLIRIKRDHFYFHLYTSLRDMKSIWSVAVCENQFPPSTLTWMKWWYPSSCHIYLLYDDGWLNIQMHSKPKTSPLQTLPWADMKCIEIIWSKHGNVDVEYAKGVQGFIRCHWVKDTNRHPKYYKMIIMIFHYCTRNTTWQEKQSFSQLKRSLE